MYGMTTTVVTDDLTQIEGIGPAVAGVLNQAGIHNFADMAVTSSDELRKILEAAGERFSFMDSATWPKQAALAAEDRWDELDALQEKLTGGKLATASGEEE